MKTETPNDGNRSRPRPFSVGHRAASFLHAFRGVRTLLATEHNAWIHLGATAAVIAGGLALRVTRSDWCWLVVAMALVWVAEAFNTALEFLADEISLEHRDRIGRAKDLGSAAVLVAALAAAVLGALVFVPHVIALAR